MSPKHRGVYPNTSVCNYPVEGKQSRQSNYILAVIPGQTAHNLSYFCPLCKIHFKFLLRNTFLKTLLVIINPSLSLKSPKLFGEATPHRKGLAKHTQPNRQLEPGPSRHTDFCHRCRLTENQRVPRLRQRVWLALFILQQTGNLPFRSAKAAP